MRNLSNRRMKFSEAMYILIIIASLLMALLILTTSIQMDQKYFTKFTIDKQLTNDALEKISFFRMSLAALSIFLIASTLIAKYKKSAIITFLDANKIIIQNLILLIVVVAMSLLLIEVSLRFILPLELKRTLPMGALEASQKIMLNVEGYRDINHHLTKKDNTLRIAVLGDSFTFGTGIENPNETYPKRLEKLLNSKQRTTKYEVLNFGKEGVDTEYEIKILQKDALKYDPDIIILGYVLNDFRDASQNKKNFYLFWGDKYIERNSYLYSLIKRGIVKLLESINLRKSYQEAIAESFTSDKNRETNQAYIAEMNRIAKNNNATLIIAAVPFIYNMNDYPFTHAHDFLRNTAVQHKILYLDTLPQLSKFNESDIVVSKYDWHPNEIGHKIIAEGIYSYMSEAGLVK